MTKTQIAARALVLAACTLGRLHGQTSRPMQSEQSQTANTTEKPLAFQVVSVKPAPPGASPFAPAFMRDKGARILGLQTMVAPVWLLLGYAYGMQKSEAVAAVRKLPDWVRSRLYSVTFRAEGEPSTDQVREMMRTMMTERFGLQVHEFTREGAINKLVMSKPGVLGPNLKPHPEGATCARQESAAADNAAAASTPSVVQCGFVSYYLPGMVRHVGITDTTIAGVARSVADLGSGGLGTRPMVDATGLTGKYDLTLEYRPDSGSLLTGSETEDGGVPSLIGALGEQLGLRVESAQGPVRMVIVDHISEPTPD